MNSSSDRKLVTLGSEAKQRNSIPLAAQSGFKPFPLSHHFKTNLKYHEYYNTVYITQEYDLIHCMENSITPCAWTPLEQSPVTSLSSSLWYWLGKYVNELKINFKSPQIQICSTGVTFLSYGETESPFLPEFRIYSDENMHKSVNLFYGGSITSFFHHQQLLTNLGPQLQCLLLHFVKTACYWLAGCSLFFSQRDDLVINSSYD